MEDIVPNGFMRHMTAGGLHTLPMSLNHMLQKKKMSKIRGRIKMSKDFQNKYVGYMLLSLVGGVLLIGLVGIMLFVTSCGGMC